MSSRSESRRVWLAERRRLVDNRYRLGVEAAGEYPVARRVAGTPLLAPADWIPLTPLPLTAVQLEFDPDATFSGVGGATALPLRPDGSRYASYADTIADLARPVVFEDRPTYRLRAADLPRPREGLQAPARRAILDPRRASRLRAAGTGLGLRLARAR